VLSSVGDVTLLAVEVSVVLLGPSVCRVTDDDGHDPITNLRRETSVSIEQIIPEKVLGGSLPER